MPGIKAVNGDNFLSSLQGTGQGFVVLQPQVISKPNYNPVVLHKGLTGCLIKVFSLCQKFSGILCGGEIRLLYYLDGSTPGFLTKNSLEFT